MKAIYIVFVVALLAWSEQRPTFGQSFTDQAVYAPLLLVNNGGGQVAPLRDGEILKVGRNYYMTAKPIRGFVFVGWRRVNGFDIIDVIQDSSGNSITVTNTVLSPVPSLDKKPILKFTMTSEDMIYDEPGVRTVAERFGYEAVFVKANSPRPRE
jgi:hypothetical protein